MTVHPRLLAAIAAGAVLGAGVIGVMNVTPAPAAAAAPISTIAPTTTVGPILTVPAADITAARAAGQRATELLAEREAATAPEAAQRGEPDYLTSGDAQRAWGCQQGYITQGC